MQILIILYFKIYITKSKNQKQKYNNFSFNFTHIKFKIYAIIKFV